MKFLLDENIGKAVANFLEKVGHNVFRIRLLAPGIEDFAVLDLAVSRNSILITSDKDFGELIIKEKQPSCGIILLRLKDERSTNKIEALRTALLKHKNLNNKFVTIKENSGKFKVRVK